AQIHSLATWKARQQYVRNTLMDIVGPFPKKTPLHAKITKTVHEEGYKVEDIVFQSQPGFYVTSSLFIPDDISKPAPAILFTSGHTSLSYRASFYQQVILNLVKKGFVVFAIDPIGQ